MGFSSAIHVAVVYGHGDYSIVCSQEKVHCITMLEEAVGKQFTTDKPIVGEESLSKPTRLT